MRSTHGAGVYGGTPAARGRRGPRDAGGEAGSALPARVSPRRAERGDRGDRGLSSICRARLGGVGMLPGQHPPGAATPGAPLAPTHRGAPGAFLTSPTGHLPAPCRLPSPLPIPLPPYSLPPPLKCHLSLQAPWCPPPPSMCPPSLPLRPLHGSLLSPPAPPRAPGGGGAWFPQASGTLFGAHSDPDALGSPVSSLTVEGPGGPTPPAACLCQRGRGTWSWGLPQACGGAAGTVEASQGGPWGQRDKLPASPSRQYLGVYSGALYFKGK